MVQSFVLRNSCRYKKGDARRGSPGVLCLARFQPSGSSLKSALLVDILAPFFPAAMAATFFRTLLVMPPLFVDPS